MKVKFSEIKLPSNKNFGFSFTIIFFIIGLYFLWINLALISSIFFIFSISFLTISFIKPNLLLPINKLWMRFGLLIGTIISPIILGCIFFILITPVSFFTRLFGRDELYIKLKSKQSHWKYREKNVSILEGFKNQF